MTLTTSHPNPWLYGGVLDRVRWEAGEMQVQCWGGRVEDVSDGDEVLVLRTPGYTQVVRVERARDDRLENFVTLN